MADPSGNPSTVLLHGDYEDSKEATADAALTPGELVARTGVDTVNAHASAPSVNTDGSAAPRFVLERRGVGQGIDTDVGAGELTRFIHAEPGDEIYAWLDAGEAVSADDPLASAGNGNLAAYTGIDTTGDGTGLATETVYEGALLARAAEAVDNGAGTERVRVRIEVV